MEMDEMVHSMTPTMIWRIDYDTVGIPVADLITMMVGDSNGHLTG